MATIALFVALGGTSYAALKITGKQVKDNSLTGRDIKNLKSPDVSNGSLLAKDFKGGELPQGPQGPQGLTGAPGEPATTYFAYIRYTSTLSFDADYGSGVIGLERMSTGLFEVSFSRNVKNCVAHANPGTGAPDGGAVLNTDVMAAVVLDPDSIPGVKDNVVRVVLTSHAGAPEDSSFMVSLFC
jgi:hypothetical protein